MKIVVIGCNGQLGTEIMKCFERRSTEIGVPSVLNYMNDIKGIDVDELDISDLSAVTDFFAAEKCDAIINSAAFTNVDKCETDMDTAFKVNALGARNIAMAAERFGAKIIHMSTDYVFDGNGLKPYAEYDICSPQSIYGKSKLLGEDYVRQFSTKHFIVRTAWLYGHYGGNFVKTIMHAAREKGRLNVVNDQRGNPTNAADLAHHILKLVSTDEYGLYHATGTGECSWFDFANRIVSLAGIDAVISPCTTEEYPRPAKRPAYSSLDNMMLRATVGDEFRHWEIALEAFIKNIKV